MKFIERLYAFSLYAYPRPFRRRFGREMQQVFRARLSAAPDLPRFLASTAWDWIITAPKERFATMVSLRSVKAGLFTALLMLAAVTMAQAYVVPTSSMEPTIATGDFLIVNKLPHAFQRDELVVFRYPADPSQTFIKRVVGIPGDRIRIRNKRVIRNGEPLTESYVRHRTDYMDSFRDNFPADPNVSLEPSGEAMLSKNVQDGEVVVPPASLFVLGDNRDASLDSRFWGFVPADNVIGRPWFVYFSYDALAHKPRWNRTFQPVR